MSLDVFDTVLSFASVMLVLSLFVTAWVQLLGGFLRLRHRNLRWGLERLLNQLDPEKKLAGQAQAVARRIASEVPALATGSTLFGGGTEALKPAELVKTLRALAANESDKVNQVVKALVGSIDTKDPPANLGNDIAAISNELVTLFPSQAKAVQEAVDRGVKRGDELARQVGDWFDTVMDRAADRFTLHTRYIAVIVSGVVVFAMGVDAVTLYTTLRSDSARRATLVAQMPELLKSASERITSNSCLNVASAAIAKLASDPDKEWSAAWSKVLPTAPKTLDAANEGLAWLNQQAQATKPPLPDALQRYNQAYADASKTCVTDRLKDIDSLTKGPLKDVSALTVPMDQLWTSKTFLGHVPGLLLAWVLLTLGAPFWFNMLKSLSSLRPLIASRSDKPVVS